MSRTKLWPVGPDTNRLQIEHYTALSIGRQIGYDVKMLDLFCGGGLAAAGYWQSGCFSEIVGVDLDPSMKRVYPFDFVHGNAWSLDYEFLLQFDFIHASPPCQWYSAMTPPWARDRHIRSIPPTHLMLKASGVPHVIENVPGSGHDLRPTLILSGRDVGLPIDRPRLFHVWQINSSHFSHMRNAVDDHISSGDDSQINDVPGSHISTRQCTQISDVAAVNMSGSRAVNVHGDEYVSRDELIEAMGLRSLSASHLRRMTITHMEQGIPPAFTRRIALSLFPQFMIA